jgi:hypothetical protein
MGDLFGLQGGAPPSDDSASNVYCNVRADECSSGHIACGERIVYFRGNEYKVVGFYFVSTPSGACDLCYILRVLSDDSGNSFATEAVRGDFAGTPNAGVRRRGRLSAARAASRRSAWRGNSRDPGSLPPVADD